MGQFSVEKPVAPGSPLSGNQQLDELVRLVGDYIGDSRKLAPSPQMRIASVQTAARKI
jgi:hypothetical protein